MSYATLWLIKLLYLIMEDDTNVVPQKKLILTSLRKNFCQEEIDELKAAYALFEDENRKIDTSKLVQVFESSGLSSQNPNVFKMIQHLEKIGSSKSGLIDFNDFLNGADQFLGRKSSDDELLKIYASFTVDGNSDSNITKESFTRVLEELGEQMPEEQLSFIFKVNSQGKGYLDFQDFSKIFKRKHSKSS